MNRLLEAPEDRKRLAENARDVFVRRLARTRVMNSLDEIYRRVLHSRSGRSEIPKNEN